MKVAIINKAKRNFSKAMAARAAKFTVDCMTLVRELAEGIDDGDEWGLIELRCFGEKLADLEADLIKGGCSNVPQYKRMLSNALHMHVCHNLKLTKLTPMADAYDKFYEKGKYSPTSKNKAAPAAKAKAETITIETSKLFDLVIQAGLNKAEATKFVKAAQKLAA